MSLEVGDGFRHPGGSHVSLQCHWHQESLRPLPLCCLLPAPSSIRCTLLLRSLLEPGEETLPLWMSDASPEMCGQLRLSAALALLRLARRHDTRITPSTYCSLALMMQDELEAVRGAFAAKVYRLMRFFLVRGRGAADGCAVQQGEGPGASGGGSTHLEGIACE